VLFKFFLSDILPIRSDNYPELFFDEHIEEIRQRTFQTIIFLGLLMILAFCFVKPIVGILQVPVSNIKFFQLSPGEYFLSTLKISFYTGLSFGIPVLLSQLMFFLAPGLNENEKKTTFGLLTFSVILLFLGLIFSYKILIPAAVKFFISYNDEVIEPLWSFEEYFGFISVLFFGTSLVFQLPIIQIILCLIKVITPKLMFSVWRYMILFATIIGAVLTPSADPITQILLSSALFFLYLAGCFISLILTEKSFSF